MKLQIVVIDDNTEPNEPFLVQSRKIYGADNVFLYKKSKEGLDHIIKNMDKAMVVVLDIKFSAGEEDGHQILDHVRQQTQLIPVIIWSAYGNSPKENFADFVNNHAFSIVNKNKGLKIFEEIQKAVSFLNLRVDVVLEQWLSAKSNRSELMLATKSGKTYSANDLLKEIRLQTDQGIKLQNNIIYLAIDLLFQGERNI